VLLDLLFTGLCIWLGVVLLVYSATIARRYVAWTTRLLERLPKILWPTTPRGRELITIITMWSVRFIGAFTIIDALIEMFRSGIWR